MKIRGKKWAWNRAMPLKNIKLLIAEKCWSLNAFFQAWAPEECGPGWMAQEQGQRESVVSTKRLGMAAPTLDLAETLRQNPFSTWEKVQRLKGQWLFWALTMYIICHNLHHLFRTVYIICRAQWKMKMWALFFKNDFQRTSLVVQWLRIHFARWGMWVLSLVRELRSYMLQSKQARVSQLERNLYSATKDPMCCN